MRANARTTGGGTLLRPGPATLDTGLHGVVSNNTTTPIFNAMTGPLNSAQIKGVRVQMFLAGVGACEGRVAVQFSNDGINWTDASKPLEAGFHSAEGWTYGSSFTNIFSLSDTTPRLFVRIGLQMRNTTGSNTEGALARLIVEMAPVPSATIPIPYQKVWTRGSTSSALFVPFSGPMPTEGISEIRPTIDFMSSTGDIQVQFGWQETNTPDDVTSWSAVSTAGTATSTEGITYGTTFGGANFTQKYLRTGISAVNASGSAIEATRVALRLDVR